MPFIVSDTVSLTFLERTLTSPERIGFCYRVGSDWQRVTFREFFERCKDVALGLHALGIRPREKVALMSATRFEWSLCDMAIIGTGAITVPVYPSSSEADLLYILAHSDAVAVLVETEEQRKKIEALRAREPKQLARLARVIAFDELTQLAAQGAKLRETEPKWFENNLCDARPDDLLTICYTSGTTGQPKGVMITHANVVSVLRDCRELVLNFADREGETILSFLPFSHILGKVESLSVYTFAFEQYFARSLDTIPDDLREVRPTLIFAVPRLFEKAYSRIETTLATSPLVRRLLFRAAIAASRSYYAGQSSGSRFAFGRRIARRFALATANALVLRRVQARLGGRLKYAICGGAPLPKQLGEFFQAVGVHILEGYGLTETCAPVAINTPAATRFGTVGRPLPEVKLRFAIDGEIQVKSEKVFKGYYKDSVASQAAIVDGWFNTGDIGHLDAEGFLHITDRKKDLIITSGGKNVAPQKIEGMASADALIANLVVFGDRRNYLSALVALDQGELSRFAASHGLDGASASELVRSVKVRERVQQSIDEINTALASYETIKKFVIVAGEFSEAGGELTASQKIRRKVIAEKYRAELDSLYAV